MMTEIKLELDHYQILGLSPLATQDEIRKAFKSIAQKHHPDKIGADSAFFIKVKKAYDCLSNPRSKVIYDQGIKQGINPEEFKKILQAATEKAVLTTLQLLERDYRIQFIPTVKRIISHEKIEINQNKEEFENKQKLITKTLEKIKEGQESIVVLNLIKQAERCKAHLLTIDVQLAVINYLQDDTHLIKWEEDQAPPQLERFAWTTLGT